jgi:hypothetical protein
MGKWGGQGKRKGGVVHFTLWRAGKGKGERVSWDQHEDGRQTSVHHTNQNTGRVSKNPKKWRQGR